MSQIVVTGAQGFIGRRLTAALAGRGHEVVAVDRLAASAPAPRVQCHVGDLAGPDPLPGGCLQPKFTLVHLAWNLDRGSGTAAQFAQVDLTARLLERYRGRASRVIAFGSAEEYGRRAGILQETDGPEEPLSDYGAAKRAACDAVRAWSAAAHTPAVWLRPFVVYGPGQGGDMVVPYALRCARERRQAEFTDGLQRRDFIHVDDVVAAVLAAVDARIDGFRVFNLGRGEGVAVREVLEMIAGRMDAKELFAIGARPRRPGEPDLQVANTAAVERALGWRARIGWREGIGALCGAAA